MKYFTVLVGYLLLAFIALVFSAANSWVHYSLALGGLIPLLVYGHFKHPKDMYSPTVTTEPVK